MTTTTATTSPPASTHGGSGLRGAVRRHPVLATAGSLIGVSWLAQLVALLAGLPTEGALLVELVAFIAVPLGLSALIGGRAEVARLLSGFRRVRIGVGRWLLVLLALPVLTLLVALVTGTFNPPPEGWVGLGTSYVLTGLLLLGVSGNLPEEMAWSGMVQTRLMGRHGLVAGSLLTAVPFALIHLPFAFDQNGLQGTAWTDVALTWGVLIGAAPVLRLLVGFVLADTRGSLLAVGLLHASFNASGALSVLGGGWWQNLVALAVLTLLVGGLRLARRSSRSPSPAAAPEWPGVRI
jgi:membrane protease YdiL (CAAX protease family)